MVTKNIVYYKSGKIVLTLLRWFCEVLASTIFAPGKIVSADL